MARFTFQQYELNLTVFVEIPILVCRPMLSNQIALNNAGLFGVSADIVGFIVAIQRLTRRFFVEENHRHVLPARFLNHRTRSCRVNQVDRQCLHPFRQQYIDLIVLLGLVILRIIHQQLNIWRGFRILLNSLAHYRHKVIVVLIDCYTNASISSVCSGTE